MTKHLLIRRNAIAIRTLQQIAQQPRNSHSRRLARSTIAFLENVKPSRKPARDNHYAVKLNGSVWMMVNQPSISAARTVAAEVMCSLGMDESDFRMRDQIIVAISPRINAMLDHAHKNA